MNRKLLILVPHLVVLAALAGCGGGGGGGSSGSPSTAPPKKVATFAYLTNSDSGQVQGSKTEVMAYTIDPGTGALSPVGHTLSGQNAHSLAGITYAENAPGVPTFYGSIKAGAGSLADISRRLWLGMSRALSINAIAAVATQSAGFAIPSSVDPSGKFAYVLNYAADSVSAYAFDAQSGAFSEIAGSPFGAGTAPYTSTFVTVDASGKFAYVANLNAVSVYAIDAGSGALSEVSGSPFPVGLGLVPDVPAPNVGVEPSGRFAYVCGQGDSIWGYALNPDTGALTQISGSPLATGAGSNPTHVTFDPLGRFAYAIHTGGPASILGYAINSATGALTQIAGSPFEVLPFTNAPGLKISFDPAGKFAYVVADNSSNYRTSTIAAYTIDPDTGALAQVPGSPFSARDWPVFVTVDPSGKFAYAANRFSDNVSAYAINAGSGALSELAGSPYAAGSFPESIRIEPSGKFAYVANSGSGSVSAYAIDPNTGALSEVAGSPFPAQGSPINLTIFRTPR